MTPLLLDAFGGEQGAGEGYRNAGWHVLSIDIKPQPRAPGPMIVAEAIDFIRRYGHLFDGIHASPPCQFGSTTQRLRGNAHPNLIAETREALIATGRPYVIENVIGSRAHLREPFMLCGAMFPGVETYRHRLFECSFPVMVPSHPLHVAPQVKMGRAPQPGEWVQAIGNFSGVQQARDAMGMPWASRDGLREAIPPAYTEYVGGYMMAEVRARTAA